MGFILTKGSRKAAGFSPHPCIAITTIQYCVYPAESRQGDGELTDVEQCILSSWKARVVD